MRVVFDHSLPFFLAHGGLQTQIEQSMAALNRQGIPCQAARWWDASQPVDLIHYFGRPGDGYAACARRKGIPLVITDLHSALGARPAWARLLQRGFKWSVERAIPSRLRGSLGWEASRLADAFVSPTAWEARLNVEMFGAEPSRVHVVPNGVQEEIFFPPPDPAGAREPWLVVTGTVTERKRIIETCQAAVLAETPLWVVGKPYASDDPYFVRFQALVRCHPRLLRYEGPVDEPAGLAKILRAARGFVLLSTVESRSFSADEAAACGCPLLLSDRPWARYVFGDGASYAPLASPRRTAPFLRRFYDACPRLPAPPRPMGWDEVGQKLAALYRTLLPR